MVVDSLQCSVLAQLQTILLAYQVLSGCWVTLVWGMDIIAAGWDSVFNRCETGIM